MNTRTVRKRVGEEKKSYSKKSSETIGEEDLKKIEYRNVEIHELLVESDNLLEVMSTLGVRGSGTKSNHIMEVILKFLGK